MNLYGTSLCKGEVLDAISREAKRLTAGFKTDMHALEAGGRSGEKVDKARRSLNAYLSFAGLPMTAGK